MELWVSVWHMVMAVLIAAGVYLFVRLGRRCLKFFLEVFLFWVITIGAMQSRKERSHFRMRAYLAETDVLDELSVNELFNFLGDSMDNTANINVKQFHQLLLSYSHVLLCREKIDGSLRGVVAYGVTRKKNYTLLKAGLAVFKRNYQGGHLMVLVTVYMFCRELLLHPLTPLYTVGKTYTFKSYLLFMPWGGEFFPRYDRETPKFYKELLQEFVNDTKLPNEHYDPERCVLEKTSSHVKPFIAPITELELLNPHIKFFNDQNPGWTKGHCLVAVARITWRGIFGAILSRARTSKRPRERHPHPKIVKRISFVDPIANRYAVDMCEVCGVSGEIVSEHTAHKQKIDRRSMYAVREPSTSELSSPSELNINFEL